MSAKWNPRCGCNCPKDAHTMRATSSGLYSDWECTATIRDGGIYWPCRCSFLEKSMVEQIGCNKCGEYVKLLKPVWLGDIGGYAGVRVISNDLAQGCTVANGGAHTILTVKVGA